MFNCIWWQSRAIIAAEHALAPTMSGAELSISCEVPDMPFSGSPRFRSSLRLCIAREPGWSCHSLVSQPAPHLLMVAYDMIRACGKSDLWRLHSALLVCARLSPCRRGGVEREPAEDEESRHVAGGVAGKKYVRGPGDPRGNAKEDHAREVSERGTCTILFVR